MISFLGANLPLVRFVLAATVVLLMTVPTAFLIIYMEMKVIALMNLRFGPDRVGPFGSALSVVHGLKVLMKEDFTPTGADPIVFTWAPVVVYMASVMTLLVIPFAPGLFGQDLNIGLLYFFAISGLTVVGLLMAGWSSFNKYSLLGGLRSAAQIVSYEIPLTLSVVGIILLTGTPEPQPDRPRPVGQPVRLVRVQAAARVRHLLHRRHRGGEPDPVRPDRGRLGDRGRLRDRVLRDALRLLLLRRVRQRVHRLRPHRHPVLRRLEGAVRLAAAWRSPPSSDLAGMGVGLLVGDRDRAPDRHRPARGCRSGCSTAGRRSGRRWSIGFVLFNVLAVAALLGFAFVSFDWVVGLFWFFVKTYVFVFIFVWMRGDAAPGPDRPAHGLRLEVAPARRRSLNLFVTALAIVIVESLR